MTNERLKEILQFVLWRRSNKYLCLRLEDLRDVGHIDEAEFLFVYDYMFKRRPFIERYQYWWNRRDITTEAWLQQKHDWLQKLIDEL